MNRPETDDPVEVALSEVQDLIDQECDAVKEMLFEKNRAYGNSALDPRRIFSKADPVEQIKVRIDDKLSRIANGSVGEDSEKDLLGYLILLRVAKRLAAKRTEAKLKASNLWEGAVVEGRMAP